LENKLEMPYSAQVKIQVKIGTDDWLEYITDNGETSVELYEEGQIQIGYNFHGVINSLELLNHDGSLEIDQSAALCKNNSQQYVFIPF